MNSGPIRRWALWPVSVAYGGIVRMRAWLYRRGLRRQQRLNGVVISVGNLTAGGTGKTPLAIWIAQRLAREGKPTGVLTRGYRGVRVPVRAGAESLEESQRISDEVLVLQSHLGEGVRIGVGADRFRHGRQIEREGVEWFVLDDGFQHLRLARDVDVLAIDATNPFDGDLLLPAGRLREPRSALARADIVVITRSEQAPELVQVLRRHTDSPIFFAGTELIGVFRISPEPSAPARSDERNGRLFAFSATGNPSAFFDDLRRWGMKVSGEASYPDHHVYTDRDARDLERVAKEAGAAALVCTEKDIWNLRRIQFEALPVLVCRISLRPFEPERLWDSIMSTALRKRAGARR